jgi:hypothetical protein
MSYEEALNRTDPTKCKTLTPGSAEEKAAIDRCIDFFSNWNKENVLAKTRHLYAENAYCFDTFKEVNGVDAIEAYLLRFFNNVESISIEVTDVAVSGGNYYFRHIADIKYKTLKRGQVLRSYAITHIRFDERGKVVLHHDYWDSASGVFEHIPLLGGLIRYIKGRA